MPSAFVIGLKNARPGSWLEKVFAREVFRFHNTQHCIQAYLALKRHGIDPRPHPNQEINVALLSLDRPDRPEAGDHCRACSAAAARPETQPAHPPVQALTSLYTLHRIYVLGWAALIIGGAVWLYPRTGVAEPLLDWYEVWQNAHGTPAKAVQPISGKVINILDPISFTLRATDRQLYSIGLAGAVLPPSTHATRADRELADRAKARLRDLVLSNEVDVAVTWMDAQRRGVGIVHLGKTNINAAMIQSGLLNLKLDYIKGIPWFDQYALLRADRRSRQHPP